MDHFGLDTGEYSFHYVATGAEDKERLHTNLEEIRTISGRIIRGVEGVGDPYEDGLGSFEVIGPGPLTAQILAYGSGERPFCTQPLTSCPTLSAGTWVCIAVYGNCSELR